MVIKNSNPVGIRTATISDATGRDANINGKGIHFLVNGETDLLLDGYDNNEKYFKR